MQKIWDFNGGIHPEQNKTQSTQQAIITAPLPSQLIIPLQQHIGNTSKPCVEIGDKVKKGQLISEAQGPISVSVHAPTSGIIQDICERKVAHPSALTDICLTIEPDGNDEWLSAPLDRDYSKLTVKEILHIVRESGIAGMGGAGFPTSIKLHPPKHDKVQTLILNAAECEPYITSDDMLMRERADQVIKGLEIMARVLSPDQCLIGIEDNKPEATEALKLAAKNTLIEVVVIPTKYPSGGEKQLIKILTGEEVPSGAIPADIGIMCQNVATAVAVYRAVALGEPLISRITTVTGEATGQPGNYEVLLGTPISELLDTAQVDREKINRLIMGGPMMGFTLDSEACPIVKTSNCIIASTQNEMPLPDPAQACIRCGFCVEACPMELLPQQLFWFAQSDNFEQAEKYNIADCIECGACSYVCPSSIPLVQYYRYAKGQIRQQKQDQLKSDKARERFEFRQFRQEREKAEKEANRKARAEAAAKAQAAKAAKEASTETEDPRAAAVAAAVARANEKKTPSSTSTSSTASLPSAISQPQSSPAPDLEAMQQTIDKLQQKIEKLETTVEGFDTSNTDAIEKTQRAIEKNKTRLGESQKALAEAKAVSNQSATSPDTEETASKQVVQSMVSVEELETLVEKAQAKCEKMQAALNDAKTNNTDTEKLERAVAKNKQRLVTAQETLAQAKSTHAPSTTDSQSTEGGNLIESGTENKSKHGTSPENTQ